MRVTIALTGEEVTQVKGKRHTPEQIVRKLREAVNSLFEAQLMLDDWRLEYNHYRPHQSLQYKTPAEYARRWRTEDQPRLS